MSQQEKERELKNIMLMEEQIKEDIKNTELRLEGLHYGADRCVIRQWELKEELRVR